MAVHRYINMLLFVCRLSAQLSMISVTVNLLILQAIYFRDICEADIFAKLNCRKNLILSLILRQVSDVQK